jgi:uncharacterized protein YbjT (DUF2867 family)
VRYWQDRSQCVQVLAKFQRHCRHLDQYHHCFFVLVASHHSNVTIFCCRALTEAGYDVYGSTRSSPATAPTTFTPVCGDYTNRADLDRMLRTTGAKKMFAITDFFGAAGKSFEAEVAHGRAAIDAAKSASVEHFVFCSVIDAESVPNSVCHFKTKLEIEKYLKSSSLKYSILRPCAFFENLDDAQNWNPLKKGSLKFLLSETCTWCSTYDIGRAAAAQFKNPSKYLGQTLDVVSYQGDLSQVAKALEIVGGVPVSHGLAVPMCVRGLFLGQDLHQMCNYFQENGGVPRAQERIATFKTAVPGAFSAEDWFRFHNRYADGTKIVQ